MSAVYYTLAAIGAFVGLLTVGIVTYLVVAVKLDHRAEAKRRAEQGREVDAAYIASLAADPDEGSPMFDRLVCEQIEKAEGWVS